MKRWGQSSRTRGLTLAELLVLLALAGLLGGIIVRLLSAVLAHSARDEIRARLQQRAMLILRRLQVDLETTNPAGFSLVTPEDPAREILALAFQPIARVTAQATVERASDRLILWAYRPERRQLCRDEWNSVFPPPLPLPPLQPKRLEPQEFARLLGVETPRREEYEGVSKLSLHTAVTPPNIPDPLELEIELTGQAVANSVERVRLLSTLRVENGL